MIFFADMNENDRIIGHYLCKFKQSLKTKTGKTYYSLKLQDKTGVVDAKVWDITNDIQDFDEGDIIKIDADALLYQNEIQMKVYKLRRSREGEYELSNYIPCSERDLNEMFNQLISIVDSIKIPQLKTLLENILIKNEEHAKALKTHSAAKQMHHGYMGGLLEHTLSVAEICEFMSSRFRYLNRDILLAGALLHDIGKLYELSPMPQNEYTDDGNLLGHIIIGVEMVAIESSKIDDFPHELASLIKHLIISHHGEYEYGSPKLPSMAEAILLHYADNMDAKLKTIEELLDKDTTPGPWIGYQKALARYIRKSDF